MNNSITLQTNSILQVPFSNYPKDFTFIDNGREFKTTKFCADLLSRKISKLHQIEPTNNEFSIKTKSKGDFQRFLDLLTFQQQNISDQDISFLTEIISILNTDNLDINFATVEISLENVIDLIKAHEQAPFFYSANLQQEIDFLSSHLYEMKEEQIARIPELSTDTIEEIISSDRLVLETEDQLLSLINHLLSKSSSYSTLYEHVHFTNVSDEAMKEFLSSFSIDLMTQGTWISISKRLIKEESFQFSESEKESRYQHPVVKEEIQFKGSNDLRGVFSYIRDHSNISEDVAVTQSSFGGGDVNCLLNIESKSGSYSTQNSQNSWICFEFKKHRIIPKNYTIQNYNGLYNPRSWVIEASDDGSEWTKIDEQNDCENLKGREKIHTFTIPKMNVKNKVYGFKFIRICYTNQNWNNDYRLKLRSIEFYGSLIIDKY